MASNKCPLCKQTLPTGVSLNTIESRKRKFESDAIKQEQERLKRQYRIQLDTEIQRKSAQIQRKATREAQQKMEKAVEQAKRNAAKEAKKSIQSEVRNIESARRKDTERHERERSQLQRQVATLSRKLEKQTSEQRGDEAEVDLFALLRAEFSNDTIRRIGKGVKGADIVQSVMSGATEVGQIVYECKNVSTWQNAFITKAMGYRTKYKTPYVMVVTTAFPRNKKSLCIVKDFPVVVPHLAPILANLIRQSIIEISDLRLTRDIRPQKARELWEYILSDDFRTKFKGVAESVEQLQELRLKEQDWHENHWTKQGKLYDQILAHRRKIDSRVRSITKRTLRMAT